MFARHAEVSARPGKLNEIIALVRDELLPFAKKQKGFVDALGLLSSTNDNLGITITLWNTEADADAYAATPEFKAIMTRLKPLFLTYNVQGFKVETSTSHKIIAAAVA